jgi:cell division protein FtsL
VQSRFERLMDERGKLRAEQQVLESKILNRMAENSQLSSRERIVKIAQDRGFSFDNMPVKIVEERK